MQTRPARDLFIAPRPCGHAPSPVGRQPAETANERSEYLRASARRGCGPRSSDELHFFVSRRRRNVCFMNIIFHSIHPRQPGPRQKRFRTKSGRGDGTLRIGNLLIASKVPSGIRFSAGARPTPKSFHRGTFWTPLLGNKRWKTSFV